MVSSFDCDSFHELEPTLPTCLFNPLEGYPVNSLTYKLAYANSPTPTGELAYVGDLITNIVEFVVPHSCIKCVIKCVCSAPNSRMIAIADNTNSRIMVSHFAKGLVTGSFNGFKR